MFKEPIKVLKNSDNEKFKKKSKYVHEGKSDIKKLNIYKEKYNYASFDCGATIIQSNHGLKNGLSILMENTNTYFLNKCRVKDKFVIIRLCQEILVEKVMIANFEYFSSSIRRFDLYITKELSSQQWILIGEFQAQNQRNTQLFGVSNPSIWTKYIKIKFLTHYGHEYYCTLSLFKVYGKTMIDDFKESPDLYKNIDLISKTESDLNTKNIIDISPVNDLKDNFLKYYELNLHDQKIHNILSSNSTTQLNYEEVNKMKENEQLIEESVFKNIIRRLMFLEYKFNLTYKYFDNNLNLFKKVLKKLDNEKKDNYDVQKESLNYLKHLNAQYMKNFEKTLTNVFSNQISDIQKKQQIFFVETKNEIIQLKHNMNVFKNLLTINISIIVILLFLFYKKTI